MKLIVPILHHHCNCREDSLTDEQQLIVAGIMISIIVLILFSNYIWEKYRNWSEASLYKIQKATKEKQEKDISNKLIDFASHINNKSI